MGAKRVYECDFCGMVEEVGVNNAANKISYFNVFTNKDLVLEAYVCIGCRGTFKKELEEWFNSKKAQLRKSSEKEVTTKKVSNSRVK